MAIGDVLIPLQSGGLIKVVDMSTSDLHRHRVSMLRAGKTGLTATFAQMFNSGLGMGERVVALTGGGSVTVQQITDAQITPP